jgi:hypothetical protein
MLLVAFTKIVHIDFGENGFEKYGDCPTIVAYRKKIC